MTSPATTSSRIPRYNPDEIDFKALARQDADFAAVFDATGRLGFQDPKAVQQLTQSLLKRDFGLKLELPDDRLCPPVPVRYNYIHWLQDLLDTSSESYNDRYDPRREVLGLDIGVGASCVYPLLATSSRPNWKMMGTDVDWHSLSYAQRNIDLNGLSNRIRISLSTRDSPVIPIKALNVEHLDFVMCNPPFYASEADMQASQKLKSTRPSAVCTGSESEMITPGGDLGFAYQIVAESTVLRDKVQWYTSMLGKLSSVHQVVAKLKEIGIDNVAVTCLQAGSVTRRWAVAWSFGDLRPRNDVVRSGELVQKILPHPVEQTILVTDATAQELEEKVDTTLSALQLEWQWRPQIATGVAMAKEEVWTRAWRRKQKFGNQGSGEASGKRQADVRKGAEDEGSDDEEEKVALGIKVTVKAGKVDVRWLRGHDHDVFVSFWGMLQRALRS